VAGSPPDVDPRRAAPPPATRAATPRAPGPRASAAVGPHFPPTLSCAVAPWCNYGGPSWPVRPTLVPASTASTTRERGPMTTSSPPPPVSAPDAVREVAARLDDLPLGRWHARIVARPRASGRAARRFRRSDMILRWRAHWRRRPRERRRKSGPSRPYDRGRSRHHQGSVAATWANDRASGLVSCSFQVSTSRHGGWSVRGTAARPSPRRWPGAGPRVAEPHDRRPTRGRSAVPAGPSPRTRRSRRPGHRPTGPSVRSRRRTPRRSEGPWSRREASTRRRRFPLSG
jgi:hypothetical protein